MKISKRVLVLSLAAGLLAGCATWSFKPTRTSRFVNEENVYLLVDYGIEEHVSTFIGPGGVRMPFRSNLKVRVELPDGERFVAFQNMSTEGRLYVSEDEEWKYLEKGVAAYVAQRAENGRGYLLRYQGTLCANVRNPMNSLKPSIQGSSDVKGAGRASSGPRDTTHEHEGN
jgi:hypothetical protein